MRAIVRPVTTPGGESAMAFYRRGGAQPDAALLAPPTARGRTLDAMSAAVAADPGPADRDDLDRLFLGET